MRQILTGSFRILTGTSGTGTSGTGTGGTGTGTSGGGFSGTGTGGSGTGSGSGTGGIGVVTAQPGGFTGVSEYIYKWRETSARTGRTSF